MKVLLTGAAGMLGSDIAKIWSPHAELELVDYSDLDITNSKEVEEMVDEFRPDVLVNTAAFTKVDECESRFEEALRVNAQAPGSLAGICRDRKIFLVHISTDYVFDGKAETAYTEESKTDPVNSYGKSKLEGEQAIQKIWDQHLIVRTSWLYGANGPNFVDKMLELAQAYLANPAKNMRVVNDQMGSPTYTVDLAKAILFLVQKKATGLFHVRNSGVCTWYDFAVEILKAAGLGEIPIQRIKSHEMPRPAKRPFYSVMSMAKLEKQGYTMPFWLDALNEYVQSKKVLKIA